MYLDDSDMVALAGHSPDRDRWWMLDFAFPAAKTMNKKMSGMLENAPFKFAPANGLTFFEDLGWRVVEGSR